MDRTLDKLPRHEAEVRQALLSQTQADLAECEQTYQLSSIDVQ